MNIDKVGKGAWVGAGFAVAGMIAQYNGWQDASDYLYASSLVWAAIEIKNNQHRSSRWAYVRGLGATTLGFCLLNTRYKDFSFPLIAVGVNVMAWGPAMKT